MNKKSFVGIARQLLFSIWVLGVIFIVSTVLYHLFIHKVTNNDVVCLIFACTSIILYSFTVIEDFIAQALAKMTMFLLMEIKSNDGGNTNANS